VRVVLALAAAAATVAALAGPRVEVATACSCAGVVPARDLARFDAAFVGTPLSHRLDGGRVAWTFEVERAVKGTLPNPIVVLAARGGSACGLELGAGERTGLLLRFDGVEYESALCYQTNPDRLARYASPHARVLGTSGDATIWPWWPVAVGAGALVTLVFGVLALRRRA
jgi:hypothetical protein